MTEMDFEAILSECMHVTIDELKERGIAEVFDGPFSEEKGKLAYPQFDIEFQGNRGFVFVYPTLDFVSECSEYEDQENSNAYRVVA